MKKIMLIVLTSLCGTIVYAYDYGYGTNKRDYKDVYGHSYKREETLDRDTDHDGVINRYDYNDKNPNIQYQYQKDYIYPTKRYRVK